MQAVDFGAIAGRGDAFAHEQRRSAASAADASQARTISSPRCQRRCGIVRADNEQRRRRDIHHGGKLLGTKREEHRVDRTRLKTRRNAL
jgi:hypothetical protein